jgi:hypothetical protein
MRLMITRMLMILNNVAFCFITVSCMDVNVHSA